LIIRKKSEDGRGVLIYLTPLVKEREISKKYSLEI
jgi:hypothetical protein